MEVRQDLKKEIVKKNRQPILQIWNRLLLLEKFERTNIPYPVDGTRAFDASDPRARLLALCGISTEAHNIIDLPQEAPPDHRKTCS